MWVKDMLAKEAKNRPYAEQLRGQIMQVQGFCGFCCALSEDEMCPGSWFERNDSEGSVADLEDAEENFVVLEVDETAKFEAVRNPTIQSWIDRIELRGIEVPVQFQSKNKTELPFDIVDDDDSPEGLSHDGPPTLTQQNIPSRLSKASFFGQLHDWEDPDDERQASTIDTFLFDVLSDGSDVSQTEEDLSQVDENQRSEATSIQQRLDALDQNGGLSDLIYDGLNKLETVDECLDEDDDGMHTARVQ